MAKVVLTDVFQGLVLILGVLIFTLTFGFKPNADGAVLIDCDLFF